MSDSNSTTTVVAPYQVPTSCSRSMSAKLILDGASCITHFCYGLACMTSMVNYKKHCIMLPAEFVLWCSGGLVGGRCQGARLGSAYISNYHEDSSPL